MNREMFLGHNLTKTRILLYENAVVGKTCVSCDKRTEFIDHVHSMCKVTHTIEPNGVKTYSGSCNQYWERSYCHHSAFLKYREELIILSEPVETHRAKHKWKKPLGNRVSDRNELVKVCQMVAINIDQVMKIVMIKFPSTLLSQKLSQMPSINEFTHKIYAGMKIHIV